MNKFIILLHLLLYHLTNHFEFVYPSIDLNPLTIDTPSSYTFTITRSFDSQLNPTPWETQLVPASSTIVIYFPSQYTDISQSSSTVTCSFLIIDSSIVTDPYTCEEGGVSGEKTVTISGAILSDSAISSVNLELSNVLNPSPALTTGTFVVQIGNDLSANQSGSAVITLEEDSFTNCVVSFSPTIVNSTADMSIQVEINNRIPKGGKFQIKFPPTLQWQNDISTNHQIPIDGVLSCNLIDSSSSFTFIESIDCEGVLSTQIVTVTPIYSASAVQQFIQGTFTFSINNLFSPPTTQPIDIIGITSLTSQNYKIDNCESTISGLTPHSMTVTLQPTVSTLFVNTNTGMRISFITADTIEKTDYFQLQFPGGSVVNYIFKTGSLTLSTVDYDSANLYLSFYQSSSSTTINSGSSENIMFLQYKAPPSIRETDNFRFVVLSETNYEKMQGFGTITAVQKSYSATVTPEDYSVSAITNYSIEVSLTDTLTTSAIIRIIVPSQLTLNPQCPTLSSSSTLRSDPFCSVFGNNITLSNINSSSNQIGSQTVSILIGNVENHFAEEQISPFLVYFYYTNDEVDLVATATSSALTMQSLQMDIFSVSLSTYEAYSDSVTYTIEGGLATPTQTSGFLILNFPSSVSMPSSQTITLTIHTLSSSTPHNLQATFTNGQLKISLQTVVVGESPSTNFSLAIGSIRNPPTTQPFNIDINTYTSNLMLINFKDNVNVQGFVPTSFVSSALVSRSNQHNFGVSQYLFAFSLSVDSLQNNSIIKSYLPIQNGGNILCYDDTKTINLGCTTITNQVTIPLNEVVSNVSGTVQFSFILTDLINPNSYQPSSFFQFQVLTSTNYLYATDDNTITVTNTLPVPFTAITYQFTNQLYGAQLTNLDITLVSRTLSNTIELDLSQFSYTTLDCQSSLNLTCTLINEKLTLSTQNSSNTIPQTFDFRILNILTPLVPGNQTISVWSYHSSYLVHQSLNAIFFTSQCDHPCATCPQSNSSICLSCYSSTSISTFVYFYSNNCFQTCPSGTYQLSFNGSEILECGICSQNCLECVDTDTYCTSCKVSPELQIYSYHNVTDNTSICLQNCISTTYLSSLQCLDCSDPCLQCSSQTVCLVCLSTYYTLITNGSTIQCLTQCPIDITVPLVNSSNAKVCEFCDSSCAKCEIYISNCTQCYTSHYLLIPTDPVQLQTCLSQCPNFMIPINSTCQFCSSPCLTCEGILDTCLTCIPTYYLSTLGSYCVQICEIFSFPNDTSGECQLCASLPQLNCLNCSSSTQCNECDDPAKSSYVYFPFNSSCLPQVPLGYVNISGVAQQCTNNCNQCATTTSNCINCAGDYSLYIDANGTGYCLLICPSLNTGISNVCEQCISPCLECDGAVDNCTSCTNDFYQSQGQCVEPTDCPSYTYPNETTQSCEDCQSPCGLCLNLSYCETCATGSLNDNGECVSTCPQGQISNQTTIQIDGSTVSILVCVDCLSPCATCSGQRYTCTSCISNYYFYSSIFRCFQDCPDNTTIQTNYTTTNSTHPHNAVCLLCESPCRQCQLTIDNCLSCVEDLYLNILTDVCVSTCPDGYYGSQGRCTLCVNNCQTCSSASTCLSCSSPRALYRSSCITTCPVTHSIIINNQCTVCEEGCTNCTQATSIANSVCNYCQSPYILYNDHCILQCPSNLIYYKNTTSNLFQCLTQEEYASVDLPETLSIASLLPLPFTISGLILCIASFMSKLQNKNTYISGMIYCWFGALEVGCLLYMTFGLYKSTQPTYEDSLYLLLIIAIGVIGGINLIALISQTSYLLSDDKFQDWYEHKQQTQILQSLGNQPQPTQKQQECCSHKCAFITLTLFALFITYKLKILLFTRLFSFSGLSAPLQSVHKFRIFNLFSFLGVIHEGLVMYIAYFIVKEVTYDSNTALFMGSIDLMIVTLTAFILSLMISKKEDDFFVIKDQKSTQSAGSPREVQNNQNKNKKPSTLHKDFIGMDSLGAIKPSGQQEDDDEISLNLTQEQKRQEHQEYEQGILNRPNHNIISSIRPIPVSNAFWIEKQSKDSYTNGYVDSPRETEKTKVVERQQKPKRVSALSKNIKVVSPVKKKQWVEVNKDKNYENILYKKKSIINNNNASHQQEKKEHVEKKGQSVQIESNQHEKAMLENNRSFQQILPFVHLNDQLIYKNNNIVSKSNIFEGAEYEEDVEKEEKLQNKYNQPLQIQELQQNEGRVKVQMDKGKYKSSADNYKLPKGVIQAHRNDQQLKIINHKPQNDEDGLQEIVLKNKSVYHRQGLQNNQKKELSHYDDNEKKDIDDNSQQNGEQGHNKQQSQNKQDNERRNELVQQENVQEIEQGNDSDSVVQNDGQLYIEQDTVNKKETGMIVKKGKSIPPRKTYRSNKNLQMRGDNVVDGTINQKEQALVNIRKSIRNKEKDIKRKKSKEKVRNSKSIFKDQELVKGKESIRHSDYCVQIQQNQIQQLEYIEKQKQESEKEKSREEQFKEFIQQEKEVSHKTKTENKNSQFQENIQQQQQDKSQKQKEKKGQIKYNWQQQQSEGVSQKQVSHKISDQSSDKFSKKLSQSKEQPSNRQYSSKESHHTNNHHQEEQNHQEIAKEEQKKLSKEASYKSSSFQNQNIDESPNDNENQQNQQIHKNKSLNQKQISKEAQKYANKSYQEQNAFRQSHVFDKSFPINSFDESSLPFKKQNTEEQEKLSNPFQASVHSHEHSQNHPLTSENGSIKSSSLHHSNSTLLNERQRENQHTISPSHDDTLPIQNIKNTNNLFYNPITQENSQQISQNDITRKPYELAMDDDEDYEDQQLQKVSRNNILRGEVQIQREKNQKLLHILDKSQLKGFKRKNKNLPKEEQDEGLGFKKLARINLLGNKEVVHKQQELKKKQKSHPLYEYSQKKAYNEKEEESFVESQLSYRPLKVQKKEEKPQFLSRPQIPKQKAHNKSSLTKYTSDLQINKKEKKFEYQQSKDNLRQFEYDQNTELTKWKEKFGQKESKGQSSFHQQSMEVPDKPLIEGMSRYKDSSREFDYEETNKSYRRGKLFDYEQADNEIMDEQAPKKVVITSKSKSKGKSRSNNRYKQPKTDLQKIYTQRLSKK